MSVGNHPFVERIRAERAMVSTVNDCRSVLGAELAGTSEKAIAAWFGQIPVHIRNREEVIRLRKRLKEAGQTAKLASNGSHRGAMLAWSIRRDAIESAIDLVQKSARRICPDGERSIA